MEIQCPQQVAGDTYGVRNSKQAMPLQESPQANTPTFVRKASLPFEELGTQPEVSHRQPGLAPVCLPSGRPRPEALWTTPATPAGGAGAMQAQRPGGRHASAAPPPERFIGGPAGSPRGPGPDSLLRLRLCLARPRLHRSLQPLSVQHTWGPADPVMLRQAGFWGPLPASAHH